MNAAIVVSVALVVAGALYIRLRWRRSPQAYRAMIDLAAVSSGKSVTLECENERSYGRLICKIFLPDGEDADLDQVKTGMAWHYKQYEDEQSPTDRTAYAAVECAAMRAKVGLWGQPNPEQPQDFRHGTHSAMLFGPDGCRISS